jgi:lipopolysaccharide transport system ATP-binding protein
MALIDIRGLTIRFPVYGADHRSLKRHLGRAVGGSLARNRNSPGGAPLVTALQNVTVKLQAGDRLGLVGHNGAGKTTLLRAIAGAYAPDEGVIEVQGKIASLLELMVGMDAFATGLENIRLRGLIMGLSGKQIKERTEEIAEFTKLGPFLGMPLKTYSAGMVARLAFAVVTSVDADILLMDEWIGVGDADFRHHAHERLMRLIEGSKIFVFASHDFQMLKLMCNKFIGLRNGRSTGVMNEAQLDEFVSTAVEA